MKHLFFVFFLYSLLSLFLVSCASSSIKEQRTLYKKGKIVESQAMAIQLLSESNPETKLQALRFLGKTKAIQAGKQVTTLFNDSNIEVQNQAMITAGKLQYVSASPLLLQGLFTKKESQQPSIIKSYQLMGTKGILPLVAAWEQTKDPVKKKKLQLVLHQLGIPAIKALALSFQNHTVFENKAKIDLIASFHSPTTGGILLELLGNKEITPSIVASLKALGSYAINPILASLQKLSIAKENIEQAKIEQGQLIVILGKLRSSKAIPLLEKYTASDDIILKSRATQALRSIRGY